MSRNRKRRCRREVSRILFDRYAPPGVVIDNDLQIVQFRGQTGAYLEPAPGEASLNLLKMSREGLLYGLRTALHSVRKSKMPVRKTGLRVKSARGWKPVNLDIIPLTSAGRPHYLVLFQEPNRHKGEGDDGPEAVKPAPTPSPRAASRAAVPARSARARTGCEPRVSPVDHPGARGGQRGIAVGQRRNPLEQRGAAEHQ